MHIQLVFLVLIDELDLVVLELELVQIVHLINGIIMFRFEQLLLIST